MSPPEHVLGAPNADVSFSGVLCVFYLGVFWLHNSTSCSTSVIRAPEIVSSEASEDALAMSDRIGVIALFSATTQQVSRPSR